MTRLTRGLGRLPAIMLALGTLALGAPAALADQYPRNWEVKSTNLPPPIYDFLPGHNHRMIVGSAAAQSAASASSSRIDYQFVPGSNNFRRVN